MPRGPLFAYSAFVVDTPAGGAALLRPREGDSHQAVHVRTSPPAQLHAVFSRPPRIRRVSPIRSVSTPRGADVSARAPNQRATLGATPLVRFYIFGEKLVKIITFDSELGFE